MTDIYFARQAILNRKNNVVAYELFYRDGSNNSFPDIDPHLASSKLIGQTHLNHGLKRCTGGKPALINFSEESLLNGLPYIVPPNTMMIEILETVTPSDEVYAAVLEFKKAGYQIALDDFCYRPEWFKFLKLANIIKFDIQETPLDSIVKLVSYLRDKTSIKLLAEKVETKEEYIKAKKMGFSFFQGYFFCQPEIQSHKQPKANESVLLELYQESLRPELDTKKLTEVFKKDALLAFKLLCYVNAGGFPLTQKISSIKQAFLYLGEHQLRRLVALLVTSILAHDKPTEVTSLSIIRAKFCEEVAIKIQPSLADDAYMTGMFSMLDVLFNCEMESILNRLPVTDVIENTLVDPDDKSQSTNSIILRAIKLLEKGSWHYAQLEARKINLNYDVLAKIYKEALIWSDLYLSPEKEDDD